MNKKNNGTETHETWCVKLWLTNDETMYRHWRERTAELLIAFAERTSEADGPSEALNELASVLGNKICDFWHASDAARFCGVYLDSQRSALCKVNWQEVARSFLEDLLPPTRAEESANDACNIPGARFRLCSTCCTPGVVSAVSPEQISSAIVRHARGDWDWFVPKTQPKTNWR
jgi:hypothetical protein